MEVKSASFFSIYSFPKVQTNRIQAGVQKQMFNLVDSLQISGIRKKKTNTSEDHRSHLAFKEKHLANGGSISSNRAFWVMDVF